MSESGAQDRGSISMSPTPVPRVSMLSGVGVGKVSLTTFVDFVSKSGTPKITVVRSFKYRDKYTPQADFYKPIREGVVDMHRRGDQKDVLNALLSGLDDQKKQTAYPEVVAGYKKFLGRKAVTWFEPPSAIWRSGELAVKVNPEVGLSINGESFVIKLYFKKDEVAKNRVEIITHMMHEALNDPERPRTFAVLDVRNARLMQPTVPVAGVAALLRAEALGFALIYRDL